MNKSLVWALNKYTYIIIIIIIIIPQIHRYPRKSWRKNTTFFLPGFSMFPFSVVVTFILVYRKCNRFIKQVFIFTRIFTMWEAPYASSHCPIHVLCKRVSYWPQYRFNEFAESSVCIFFFLVMAFELKHRPQAHFLINIGYQIGSWIVKRETGANFTDIRPQGVRNQFFYAFATRRTITPTTKTMTLVSTSMAYCMKGANSFMTHTR